MEILRLGGIGAVPLLCLACVATPQPRPPTLEPLPLEPLPPYRMTACSPNEKEAELAKLLLSSPLQGHKELRCNGVLETFARQRAEDMSRRGYLSHRTPESLFPNDLLRIDYPLPRFYSKRGNQVEAIAAGLSRAEDVWNSWLASDTGHREHVLGETDFYREQNEYGIAYVHNPHGEYGDFWVLILARKARAGDPRLLCPPPPGDCFRLGTTTEP